MPFQSEIVSGYLRTSWRIKDSISLKLIPICKEIGNGCSIKNGKIYYSMFEAVK